MKTPSSGSALTALQFTDSTLSPEQKRFNKLLAQTETLAQKIETMRALADVHRGPYDATLRPLEAQRHARMSDMVHWLAARLKQKGLTAKQKRMAAEILCGLAATLAMLGDASMQELHDAHSDMSMAEQEQAAAAGMQGLMESMLGKPLANDQPFESMDALRQALEQEMQEIEDANAAKKAARKKTPRQQQAALQAQDADGALRTIYRQLVSALHPDRENDPHERERKTALMKEVNTAYEQRNLLALLQLQLQAALADGDKVGHLAREKLVALSLLLKERVAVLKQELFEVEMRIRSEFQMDRFTTLSAASLTRQMLVQQQDVQQDIALMTRDLQEIQDDAQFKRWLKEQQETAQEQFDPFELNPFF